jgi:hypothetical protein
MSYPTHLSWSRWRRPHTECILTRSIRQNALCEGNGVNALLFHAHSSKPVSQPLILGQESSLRNFEFFDSSILPQTV